ncbi:protein sel-1 homolog 1 [Adelges cooleyi]|uniref:protein sel-1 homolog 1 n=1 Tax=Adelges cooleyi TaxID=133065 RepID=UPI00217F28C0|nr:protein sel-1 homolog 1 [Adelges cooleyi]
MKERLLLCWFLFLLVAWVCAEKKDSKEDEEDNYDLKTEVKKREHTASRVFQLINEAAMEIVGAPDLTKEKPMNLEDDQSADQSKSYDLDSSENLQLIKFPTDGLFTYWADLSNDDISLQSLSENSDDNDVELEWKEPTTNAVNIPNEEVQTLYQTGLRKLKSTRGDNLEAYDYFYKASLLGHEEAKAKYAFALLFGLKFKQNIAGAYEIFNELSEKGNPDAHLGMGFLYAVGLHVHVSQPKALVHYVMAAVGGNVLAQLALGYRYFAGATVAYSCEKALEFYKFVANNVANELSLSGGPLVQRIKLMEEMDNPNYNSGIVDSDLLDYYKMLANKGDTQAQVGLGQLYLQGGRGVPIDIQTAQYYFQKAAENGNALAYGFLGKIYLEERDDAEPDYEKALEYFYKAAKLKNPVGQSGLGFMYLSGLKVTQDYSEALNWFTLAAEQGWVEGHLYVGMIYYKGLGVKRDYKLAIKNFGLASKSGNLLAYYHMAQMHATGIGVLRSCPTALELFKNVAERGKWGSYLMHAYNAYKENDFKESFVLYSFLAELGYEVAQSNTAFILDRGDINLWESEKERYVRAMMYWSRSGAQGYAAAQLKLGDYHYYGLGTKVDYEMAANYYRQASEQHHNAQAMFNLGYMHEMGLGMEQDIHLAKRCYDMAAETSLDAKVPVFLALAKLNLLHTFGHYYNEISNIMTILSNDIAVPIGFSWDLYLIAVLFALLSYIIYLRRPNRQVQNT